MGKKYATAEEALAAGVSDRYLSKKFNLGPQGREELKARVAGSSGSAPAESSEPSEIVNTAAHAEAVLGRESKPFAVTGSMEEVATVGAGQSSLSSDIVGQYADGNALLYDSVTGKLYRTENWRDVQRNWDKIIGRDGQLQKVIGVTGSGEIKRAGKAGVGGIDIVMGYNETLPEAGTAEFDAEIGKRAEEAIIGFASRNQYDPEKGYIRSSQGQYGSITAKDWVELGRPKVVGNDTILGYDEYSGYTDEQLTSMGDTLLFTQDRKNRSHGVEKALNNVGKIFGDDNFGHEFLRTMSDLGSIPILGDIFIDPYLKPIQAYEDARDMGLSSSEAARQAGKAGIQAVGDGIISALKTAAAVAVTAATGGFGAPVAVALGGLTGAATGYAGSLASSGLQRSLYGSGNAVYGTLGGKGAFGARLGASVEDTGDILKGAEKAGAMGAITGAAGTLGARLFPTGGEGLSGSGTTGGSFWESFKSSLSPFAAGESLKQGFADIPGWASANSEKLLSGALRGGAQYFGTKAVFKKDFDEGLRKDDWRLAMGAISTGMSANPYELASVAKEHPLAVAAAEGARVGFSSPLGAFGAAFNELMAETDLGIPYGDFIGGAVRGTLGRGTATREFAQAAMGSGAAASVASRAPGSGTSASDLLGALGREQVERGLELGERATARGQNRWAQAGAALASGAATAMTRDWRARLESAVRQRGLPLVQVPASGSVQVQYPDMAWLTGDYKIRPGYEPPEMTFGFNPLVSDSGPVSLIPLVSDRGR